MGLFDLLRPRIQSRVRCGDPEWNEQQFDIDDRRIPKPIREQIATDFRPGYALFFADTNEGGEWWLLDGDNLIEAYWLE
jgi:hypothetical protein